MYTDGDGELSGATATASPDDPESQVASDEAAAAAAVEPTAESPESETKPAADDAQPPAPLPEGWDKHPDTKDIFDGHYNRGRGDREKQLRTEMDRREERHGSEVQDSFQQGMSSQVAVAIKGSLQAAIRSAEEGDKEELRSLVTDNAQYVELFNGYRADAAEAKLVMDVKSVVKEAGLPAEAIGELSDLEGDLAWKVRHKEITLAPALKELIEASYKHIKALGAADEKERRDKLEREMGDASGRAEERSQGKPPAAPSGSGAGGKAPRGQDELGAMTQEQIAALPDEELDKAILAG